MANFWCKICGQQIIHPDGAVVATCGFCGARQVLPNPISDEYLEYYTRLVGLQQSGKFEEAEELFESLLLDGGADAALYWLGVLIDYRAVYSRTDEGSYKIECGNALETVVPEHEMFQKVIHYASPAQRGIFEKDGRKLEAARIFMINGNEEGDSDPAELPLNRGFMCLESGAWDAADAQFDKVLADEPENALAYFGKMMAELQVHREAEIISAGTRISECVNYEKVMQHGDELICDRLKRYRESGILFQAMEHGKCAETVDDWRHIKKLLLEIRHNDRAAEYLSLCDRKIRAIMVREAQLVMGCREAVNLGITTETLGTRMVSANYYYDFDMSDEGKKKHRGMRLPAGRTVAIFALIVILILAAVLAVSFLILGGDDDGNSGGAVSGEHSGSSSVVSHSVADSDGSDDENEIKKSASDERSEYTSDICTAGSGAFVLDRNGRVICLNGSESEESDEADHNGASFAVNVSPYESDYDTWTDVSRLYNDPDGAMIFAVMKNGTVAYDIFSSSKMNYEAVYKSVSSWMNVRELIWESGAQNDPCLFAITKDGGLYVSDTGVEKIIRQMLDSIVEDDICIEKLSAKSGTVYIIMSDGSYVSVKYR